MPAPDDYAGRLAYITSTTNTANTTLRTALDAANASIATANRTQQAAISALDAEIKAKELNLSDTQGSTLLSALTTAVAAWRTSQARADIPAIVTALQTASALALTNLGIQPSNNYGVIGTWQLIASFAASYVSVSVNAKAPFVAAALLTAGPDEQRLIAAAESACKLAILGADVASVEDALSTLEQACSRLVFTKSAAPTAQTTAGYSELGSWIRAQDQVAALKAAMV